MILSCIPRSGNTASAIDCRVELSAKAFVTKSYVPKVSYVFVSVSQGNETWGSRVTFPEKVTTIAASFLLPVLSFLRVGERVGFFPFRDGVEVGINDGFIVGGLVGNFVG